jgi:hypothetical protein
MHFIAKTIILNHPSPPFLQPKQKETDWASEGKKATQLFVNASC